MPTINEKKQFEVKKFIYSSAMVILAIAIGFIVSEVFLRIGREYLDIKVPKDKFVIESSGRKKLLTFINKQKNRLLFPNVKIVREFYWGNKKEFTAYYSSDQFGRRLVADDFKITKKNRHIIFFGCSQTFGLSVNDEETIPTVISNKLYGKYEVLNYGISAGSMANMLYFNQNTNLIEQIKTKEGIGLYLYFNYHVERVSRPISHAYKTSIFNPVYELGTNGNELNSRGMFYEIHPFHAFIIRHIYSYLELSRYFLESLFIDSKIKNQEKKLAVAIIKKSVQEFKSHFPGSEFYIVMGNEDTEFEDLLNKDKIKYFSIAKEIENAEFFPHEGHYTASGNKMIADAIINKLIQNKIVNIKE